MGQGTAKAIRELRETAGLSKIELAARSGVSRMTIHRVESGATPSNLTISKLLGGLGVNGETGRRIKETARIERATAAAEEAPTDLAELAKKLREAIKPFSTFQDDDYDGYIDSILLTVLKEHGE